MLAYACNTDSVVEAVCDYIVSISLFPLNKIFPGYNVESEIR